LRLPFCEKGVSPKFNKIWPGTIPIPPVIFNIEGHNPVHGNKIQAVGEKNRLAFLKYTKRISNLPSHH